jgi:N-acyl-D-amino-acid deacylase
MFDVIIRGGTVYDGTGCPAIRADVGIVGEKIDAIGDLSNAEARRFIEADGLAVSPGFIDTHTHSEGDLLVNPQHANGLRQGITTEIMGLDGMSFAPLSAQNYSLYRRYLGGILGDSVEGLDMSSIAAFRENYHRKVAINTAYLIPHGAIRLEILGFHDLPLEGQDLEQARRMIREGIEQGAVGFSTGASYYPSIWADTKELIELCRSVHEAGGVYVDEPRLANRDRAFGGDGVTEGLEIARQSGVRVHFAHYRTGAETAGQVATLMEPFDQAKAEGVDCTMDIYPYPTGSSICVASLPSDAQEGGPELILQRLRDGRERKRISDYLEEEHFSPLDEIVFSSLPKNKHLEGMSLPDVARQRGASLGETLCDLLLDEELKVGYLNRPPLSTALWRQVSRDSLELLARPDYMVCSDITPLGSMPHPRCYGAFPRFLGRLRRQFGILSLEQMVQRMTDNPARRFGITGRGRIEKGYFADMVVFDPERVIDTATYDDPRQFPIGIPFVLVNGQVAVDSEKCSGILAGQAVP